VANVLDYDRLALDIRSARTPREAQKLAKVMKKDGELEVEIMRQLLVTKAKQCQEFTEALNESANKTLSRLPSGTKIG
jgi:predicted NAD-dependent protein-ADP-ribosyltransferase YbiA (DUF1768 family)